MREKREDTFMTPEAVLHRKLGSASRRIRLLIAYRYASWLALFMAGLSLLWLLASKVYWVEEPAPEILAGIVFGAAVLGALFGYARRVTTLDAARITDKRTQMKERLASAVEFEGAHSDDPLIRRQIEDAGEHARTLDLRRTYPLKLTRESVGAGVLALVLFGAFFLPTLPIFWSAQRKSESEQVKKHGIKIEKIAVDSEKASDEKKLVEAKKASREAKALAKAMKAGKMDKKQAMVKLNKLTRNIAEQQKRLAAANFAGSKSLEQAAREIRQALEQERKAADKALKAKQQNADPRNPGNEKKSDAMKKSQEALQKFTDALQQQNPEGQNQALQELAQQMQSGQMSQKEMQQLQKQMEKIAEAMKGTNLDKAAKQLAELARQMKSMNLDPETLKKLAQMAQKAGGT